MHRFLLHNGEIRESSEKLLSPGQVGLLNGWGVFSTVRVYDGVLFAFERHWARMQHDAKLMRVPFPADIAGMRTALLRLVAANGAYDATLRVAVIRNRGGMWEGPNIDREADIVAFTADVKDWGSGVSLVLVSEARHSASPFAGTKILSWSANLAWLEEAQSRGFDEVILLNERGEVSEGSQVWTPPLSSGCLPGITRALLLEEISVPGIAIGEKVLLPGELEMADEVFITSTTRGLLPVERIEGLSVRRQGSARPAMQEAFLKYVNHYVATTRREGHAAIAPASKTR
jgi:branched-chain amino acid aminotransferase